MKPEMLRPKAKSSAVQLLNRRKQNGNELFGLPYRTAISLVYGGGFLLGVLIFWKVGMGWCPTVSQGERGQQDFVYSFGTFGLFVVLIGAMLITAAAFLGNFEETWLRLGILAAACGFLVFGLWAHAIHKIEIHPDRLVVRGPFSPIAATWSLTDGNRIVTRMKRRNPDLIGWGRGRNRTTISTIHYIRSDGSETRLGRSGSPVWFSAMSRFDYEWVNQSARKTR